MAIALIKGKIPFDKNGNLLNGSYMQHWTKDADVVWKDNDPFYEHFILKQSAGNTFVFTQSSNGARVDMFETEFNLVFMHMYKGELAGQFKYVQRGRSYGLVLIKPEGMNDES